MTTAAVLRGRSHLRRLLAFATAAASVLGAGQAYAEAEGSGETEPSAHQSEGRTGPVERALIGRALEEAGRTAVLRAEGMPICSVGFVRYPVLGDEDPLPDWLNVFHTTSRQRTVSRLIPFEAGDLWHDDAARDAERELRASGLFAAAAVVAVEADDPVCVDVIVATRDIWSLTLSWFPETAGTFQSFALGVTESNIAGSGHLVAASFDLGADLWSIGPTWSAPRLGRDNWRGWGSAELVFDREGGRDGEALTAYFARPLVTAADRQAWEVSAGWDERTWRRYRGDEVARFDAESTAIDDNLREIWREARFSTSAAWTYSLGGFARHDVTPYAGFESVAIEPVLDGPADPLAVEELEAERLPEEAITSGPGVRWSHYVRDYFTLYDYDTLGFAEELRAGVRLGSGVRWVEPGLGSTRRYARLSANIGWLERLGTDSFVFATLDHAFRLGQHGASDVELVGAARWVSSRALGGRILARVAMSAIFERAHADLYTAGADSQLRGYPIGRVYRSRVGTLIAEWRSRPLRLWTWRLGVAAFSDTAIGWDTGGEAELLPSVGVGLRLVVPEFWSDARSLDIAFPLRGTGGGALGFDGTLPAPLVTIRMGQAF